MSEQARPVSSAAEVFGSDRMWGLKELPLPEPVPFWPQTWGWAVLAGLLLLAMVVLIWRLWRRWQRNAYRRDGLVRLERILADSGLIGELPEVLRQAALSGFARVDVAHLRGHAWTDWLNRTAGRKLFEKQAAALLDRLAYVRDSRALVDPAEARRLVESAKAWMRGHRAAA